MKCGLKKDIKYFNIEKKNTLAFKNNSNAQITQK